MQEEQLEPLKLHTDPLDKNELLREKFKPLQIDAAEVIIKNGFYIAVPTNLSRNYISTTCGIYVLVDKQGNIRKYGAAGNFISRLALYDGQFNEMIEKDLTPEYHVVKDFGQTVIKDGVEELQFRIVVNFDQTDECVDIAMTALFHKFLNIMEHSIHLHPFHQVLAHAIHCREGWRLGLKKWIFLLLIEGGFQMKHEGPFKVASPQEFLMFDRTMCDQLYERAISYSNGILDLMPNIKKHAEEGGQVKFQAYASWPTGYTNNLSNQIVTNQCVVGPDGTVEDLCDEPVYQNPQTAEEAFTSDHPHPQTDAE